MKIPSKEMLEAWERGYSISDEDLATLQEFFAAMVEGCEALGPRYSLATMALRMELDSARSMQSFRRMR